VPSLKKLRKDGPSINQKGRDYNYLDNAKEFITKAKTQVLNLPVQTIA
jgi:hypothetical protein